MNEGRAAPPRIRGWSPAPSSRRPAPTSARGARRGRTTATRPSRTRVTPPSDGRLSTAAVCPWSMRPFDGRAVDRRARCGAKRPCCMRTSMRSTPRSSNATHRRYAVDRSSSAVAWCWRRATRRRREGCAPRWAVGRRVTCAPRPWWYRHGWRHIPRQAETCSLSSAIRHLSWRGCRSTRRSWKSVVCGASRSARACPRCAYGSGFELRWVFPSRSGLPGPSSSPRSRAR
jgi:hypothetical protein